MASPLVRPAVDADRRAWDAFALGPGGGNPLSTWGWGELRRRQGWTVDRLIAEQPSGEVAGTMWVQLRRGPLGAGFAYAPRGPLVESPRTGGDAAAALVAAARALARRRGAVVLKADPEWREDDPDTAALQRRLRLRPSWYDVQHRKTYLVSLEGGGDAVLSRVKGSTRRAIRVCDREGVVVEVHVGVGAVSAIDSLYPLLGESAGRNRFNIRHAPYYREVVESLSSSCQVAVTLAAHEGRIVAGVMAVACGSRLVYLYGGNRVTGGRVHPAYAVQWAAINWGIERGCAVYDMWGVPNHEDPTRPGFGYYEFKTRFNGEVVRHVPCQDVRLWPLGPLPRLAERVALRGRPMPA